MVAIPHSLISIAEIIVGLFLVTVFEIPRFDQMLAKYLAQTGIALWHGCNIDWIKPIETTLFLDIRKHINP